MKIFNSIQLSTLDKASIIEQNITSWELMEQASIAFLNALPSSLLSASSFQLFCGVGNNGGDGLAIAYHLAKRNKNIQVFIVSFSANYSKDFKLNLERLKQLTSVPIVTIESESFPLVTNKSNIVIDAIFGVGLSRSLPSWVISIITTLNASGSKIISVDLPSGMFMDRPTNLNECIQASLCLTFQSPKLPLLLPLSESLVQNWDIVPIGLSSQAIASLDADYYYLSKEDANAMLKPRNKFAHKGDFGHSLLVGGSQGMIGSIVLAASSCMRSGVGKTTVLSVQSAEQILVCRNPEIMFLSSDSLSSIKIPSSVPNHYSSIGVGCGLGREENNVAQLSLLFKTFRNTHFVIDADALFLMGKHRILLEDLPNNCILTPHLGELHMLIGSWENDYDMLLKSKDFANKHGLILLVKGAHSFVTDGKDVHFNSTGNNGMATAGSGDVLTGLIAGLLAQGYDLKAAGILGMYVHGLAGDLAANIYGERALMASTISESIGKAFLSID